MDTLLPYLIAQNEDDSEDVMLMVMMNSMTGGLDTADGFNHNFNMLLPLLLKNDDSDDTSG